MHAVLLVLLLVGAVAAAWIAWQQAGKRREALAALAAEMGWRFDPSHDGSHDEEYAHFEIFRCGHSRAAYNTLTGSLDVAGRAWPVKTGDFRFKTTSSNGKTTQTTTHHFSYLILHLPFAGVPDLLIRREGLLDKLAGALGFDDIDFESEEFSRAFHVKSPDKRFAWDVLHPRMMEWLMEEKPPAIDIERGRCCITDARSCWSPEEFRARLRTARGFFGQWPEHVTAGLEAR